MPYTGIWSSITGGLFSLAQTGVNYAATSKLNKKQRKFAQQQQEDAQQHDILMQSNQFEMAQELANQQYGHQTQLNEQAYEQQQRYFDRNLSIQAQRQQLEEAGLNPYLAMDGSPGSASSMPSGSASMGSVGAPSSGAVGTPSVYSPPEFDVLSDVLDTYGKIQGFEETKQDIKQKYIDNFYRDQGHILDQMAKWQDYKSKGKNIEIADKQLALLQQQYDWNDQTFSERVRGEKLRNDEMEQAIQESKAHEAYMRAQEVGQVITNMNLDETQRMQISLMSAEAGNLKQLSIRYHNLDKLTVKQQEQVMWQIADEKFDAMVQGFDKNGQPIDEERLNILRAAYLEEIEAEISATKGRAFASKVGPFADFVGSIIGGFLGTNTFGKGIKYLRGTNKAKEAVQGSMGGSLGDVYMP